MTSGAPAPHVVRRGEGRPLVFVHGNGVDHRMLLDLDDVFDGPDGVDGWQRIHLDLPGFGRTPALPAPGGLPELADWLATTVAELVDGRRFALLGASLGALLAREVAARSRDRVAGLALLAPVVDSVRSNRTLPAPEVLERDPALLASLDPADAADYAELAVVQSPENWARFRAVALPGIRAADPRAIAALGERYALDDLPDDRLAVFDGPVLIVAGRQDAVVGYEDQWRLAGRLPRASFALLDRAGHNLHVDQPDAVRALLRLWLGDVDAAESRHVNDARAGDL